MLPPVRRQSVEECVFDSPMVQKNHAFLWTYNASEHGRALYRKY